MDGYASDEIPVPAKQKDRLDRIEDVTDAHVVKEHTAGAVSGAVTGGVAGALIDMGFSENDAKEYENYLNEGNILVLVDDRDNRKMVYDNFYENQSMTRDRYNITPL